MANLIECILCVMIQVQVPGLQMQEESFLSVEAMLKVSLSILPFCLAFCLYPVNNKYLKINMIWGQYGGTPV